MLTVQESQVNPGVVHVLGFNGDSYDKNINDELNAKRMQTIVEGNKDKLLQATLIPSQMNVYKKTLAVMYKLGFEPVFTHTNPNTRNTVRMFLRKPDWATGLKEEPLKVWTPSAEKVGYSHLNHTTYHGGSCCGYCDVRGVPYNKAVLEYQGYKTSSINAQRQERLKIYQTLAAITGEMKLFWAEGMAFQMFAPKGMLTKFWLSSCIGTRMGFKSVFSYACPTNKMMMEVLISSSNALKVENWEELDRGFKLGITKEEKVGTDVPTKAEGPLRDEYGRFASRNRGLGMGDILATQAAPVYMAS